MYIYTCVCKYTIKTIENSQLTLKQCKLKIELSPISNALCLPISRCARVCVCMCMCGCVCVRSCGMN